MSSKHLYPLHGAVSPPPLLSSSKPRRIRPPYVEAMRYAKIDGYIHKLELSSQMRTALLAMRLRMVGVAWVELVADFSLGCTL